MDSGVMLPPPSVGRPDPYIDALIDRAITQDHTLNLPDAVCGKGLHVGNPHCGGGGFEPPPNYVPDGGTLGLMLVGAAMLAFKRAKTNI